MCKTPMLLSGLVSLGLSLSLTACGTEAPIVKPMVVRERVPVYVPLRPELTADIAKPVLSPTITRPVNDDLQQLAEERGTVIDQLRAQLAEIRKLQPSP